MGPQLGEKSYLAAFQVCQLIYCIFNVGRKFLSFIADFGFAILDIIQNVWACV